MTERFPSPCGEKVGINGAMKFWDVKGHYIVFPSPCGEKVGINGVTSGSHSELS